MITLTGAVGRRLVADAPRLDPRTRRFTEIESWIIAKEHTLRFRIWDCPVADVPFRLVSAERAARRRGQLAESARLACARRRADGRLPEARVSQERVPRGRQSAAAGWPAQAQVSQQRGNA